MLKKLFASRKGQIAVITGLVVAAVAILVGILVFYKIAGSIPTTGLSSAATSAISNVQATAGSAFNLAPVILIVLVASAVLGVLIAWTGAGPTRLFKPLKRMLADTKGQVSMIMGIVVTAVSIILGIVVFAQIEKQKSMFSATEVGYSMMTSAASTAYAAFNLAPVILIVLIASAILGILVAWTGRGR